MRESVIEKYLVDTVNGLGGCALKWASPGQRGVPDRICIFPEGWAVGIAFVELKATGAKPTKLQTFTHNLIRRFGQKVFVLDSKDAVDDFIRQMQIGDA